MLNIKTLKRQHEEIYDVIAELRESMGSEGDLENRAFEIAQKISLLAGKLKIHLGTEDRYMYPYIMENGSDELKKAAESSVKEMGDISAKFLEYKDRFNTRSKILNDLKGFLSETSKILHMLEERMKKEDSNLYRLLV